MDLRIAHLYAQFLNIYGDTGNLKRRLAQHAKERAWELVYDEAYKAEQDARRRERQLKHHAQAVTALKMRIKESIR